MRKSLILIILLIITILLSANAAFSADITAINYRETSLPRTLAAYYKEESEPPISQEGKSGKEIASGIAGQKPEDLYFLKKADIARIGAEAAYEEYSGLRFAKYFTVGQRVEIYQEAKPMDTYILDAKAMRILLENQPWNTKADFRSQITPQFTRAYGTEGTIDDPDDPEAKIRYTHDYRDIYRQYYPKYPTMKVERWDQNQIMIIHSKRIPGIDWLYTSNLGYRHTYIEVKNDLPAYEIRHTYIASISIAPSDNFEWFGQYEYYKSKRIKSTYPYSPDHIYYRTELRIKSDDQKTLFIPFFSYSTDFYFPFKNRYEKYEMGGKLGRDFTDRLKGSTLVTYVLGVRDEPDNTAPSYAEPNPFKDTAAWVGTENRLSYNFWYKFYLQGGVDYAAGINMSDFDNWGTFLGIEYYQPGILRANFGWDTNHYYNIDDFLNAIGFRVYIFM